MPPTCLSFSPLSSDEDVPPPPPNSDDCSNQSTSDCGVDDGESDFDLHSVESPSQVQSNSFQNNNTSSEDHSRSVYSELEKRRCFEAMSRERFECKEDDRSDVTREECKCESESSIDTITFDSSDDYSDISTKSANETASGKSAVGTSFGDCPNIISSSVDLDSFQLGLPCGAVEDTLQTCFTLLKLFALRCAFDHWNFAVQCQRRNNALHIVSRIIQRSNMRNAVLVWSEKLQRMDWLDAIEEEGGFVHRRWLLQHTLQSWKQKAIMAGKHRKRYFLMVLFNRWIQLTEASSELKKKARKALVHWATSKVDQTFSSWRIHTKERKNERQSTESRNGLQSFVTPSTSSEMFKILYRSPVHQMSRLSCYTGSERRLRQPSSNGRIYSPGNTNQHTNGSQVAQNFNVFNNSSRIQSTIPTSSLRHSQTMVNTYPFEQRKMQQRGYHKSNSIESASVFSSGQFNVRRRYDQPFVYNSAPTKRFGAEPCHQSTTMPSSRFWFETSSHSTETNQLPNHEDHQSD